MEPFQIRYARPEDFSILPEIEKDAAQAFQEIGMTSVAEMDPLPSEFYQKLPMHSCIVIAENEAGILGFAVAKEVDGQAYLLEISVSRSNARQGLGRALCHAVMDWAIRRNYKDIVLTTYREVPFNAPFYHKLGFQIFQPDDAWPELKVICEMLANRGLGNYPRVAMKKQL